MNRRHTSKVLSTVFFCGFLIVPSVVSAGGNSSWGWAKPMNKRMGAFYTSNKNANFNRQRTKRYPANQYQVTRYNNYVPAQPVSPPPVIHQQHYPVTPAWQNAKPVVPAIKSPVQHNPVQQIQPSAPSSALPFRSKANQYWQ